jgi:bifunctional DNA-binding transcriptional regulator/antitoxin component of YhaV-PrlF toxin-antitoxin module
MQLQRIPTHHSGKEYHKHQITIPNDAIRQLEWDRGDSLETRVTERGLFVYRVEPKQQHKRTDYGQFKEAIISTLMASPTGCTWEELRLKAGLPQKTPSPIWTKRMEDEKILERIRDPATSQIIWKLPAQHDRASDKSKLNGWITETSRNAQ